MVGRARGLMETWEPGYRVNRCREGHNMPCLTARPGELLLPGLFYPCSRAGNTPQNKYLGFVPVG